MSHFKRHVFFCCNQRDAPEKCCASAGAAEMHKYAKDRVKALGLAGPGKVRVNRAGCLDRCEEAPVVVVYPEAVWYTYVDRADIDRTRCLLTSSSGFGPALGHTSNNRSRRRRRDR